MVSKNALLCIRRDYFHGHFPEEKNVENFISVCLDFGMIYFENVNFSSSFTIWT